MGIIERTAMWGGYCNTGRMININRAHTTQMTLWQCVLVAPLRKMQHVCVVHFSRLEKKMISQGQSLCSQALLS